MATYNKVQYLLPPVSQAATQFWNRVHRASKCCSKSLTVIGIDQVMLRFLVLFILRLRDVFCVPQNHVPTESRELRIVEATEMAVIFHTPLQTELVKLKRIVKRIIVSGLTSNHFYMQLRHILVVKLVVMLRLDKEMTMIRENLFVVPALMFQGLRWVITSVHVFISFWNSEYLSCTIIHSHLELYVLYNIVYYSYILENVEVSCWDC